mgnify:CR=1 FL=1
MEIARVIGNIVSTECYEAYRGRKLMLVQKMDLERRPLGPPTMAIDYVGAGEGDFVLVGAAPGLASKVLRLPNAPVRELIMGVIDRVSMSNGVSDFGNSVSGTDIP